MGPRDVFEQPGLADAGLPLDDQGENALGTAEPEHPDFEKATDKATLVEAMKASVAYCNTAYQMSDADAMKETQFFGSTMTRLAVLVWNATHDGEHYGNLVVYMRANGMIPPSSQGGS